MKPGVSIVKTREYMELLRLIDEIESGDKVISLGSQIFYFPEKHEDLRKELVAYIDSSIEGNRNYLKIACDKKLDSYIIDNRKLKDELANNILYISNLEKEIEVRDKIIIRKYRPYLIEWIISKF